jgi:hypothetical protein
MELKPKGNNGRGGRLFTLPVNVCIFAFQLPEYISSTLGIITLN